MEYVNIDTRRTEKGLEGKKESCVCTQSNKLQTPQLSRARENSGDA